MWIQLDAEDFEKLATLAEVAAMPRAAVRIRHALARQAQAASAMEGFRKEAKNRFGREGELEIDDDAAVSLSEDAGAYVMAWRWVD